MEGPKVKDTECGAVIHQYCIELVEESKFVSRH